jgi:hypothetical protein
VIDAVFQVPGAVTPAVVTGFGAVFSDVDVDQSSSIEQGGTGQCVGIVSRSRLRRGSSPTMDSRS